MFHRPGTATPNIGRTLVLIYNENLPGQLIQYVRITKVTTETRTFTYNFSGSYVDYQASVSPLDLSDALRYNFPGSPPDRSFGRNLTKTLIRDTTVADAAVYYGASPLVWCLRSKHQIIETAARATDAKMVSALLCHTKGLGS